MALRLEKLSDNLWAFMDGNTVLMELVSDAGSGSVNIRGTFKMGTDLVSPSSSELAALDGLTATSTELNKLAGATVTTAEINYNDLATLGTGAASKAVVLDAGEDYVWPATGVLKYGVLKDSADTTISPTGAQINLLTQGVAAGYKIARSATPLALDGSNPTSAAHGLTTCVAAFASLAGSAAPGVSTSVITTVINGANLDFYAWKITGVGDATLIASTGTETFNWFALGT